ncbi:helix-turn-helix domain-containing protein [Haladaptatus sp. CMSO5]|uniref:helix-turn-helix domain-containing protein n=1 Tax=Haladaptatus sp. CMSO5 TaxID=3120514 RepID=UPI002FCE2032
MSTALAFAPGRSNESTTVAQENVEPLLKALDDTACRAVLMATKDSALSAHEIAAACDLPVSTTYRKVNQLTDVGLLEERTRLSLSGNHTSEYVRAVENIVVSVSSDHGLELTVSPCEAASAHTSF